MKPSLRHGRLPLLFASALALLLATGGCEDDTVPVITKLEATPACDVLKVHTQVIKNPDGSVARIDTLGVWLDVDFFARVSSGNTASDPTGANSPLEWRWSFGDGATAGNVVNPTHRYTQPGVYEVTLSVEDEDGDKDSRTLQILVGQVYSDLDVLHLSVRPVPRSRYVDVAGSTSAALQRFGSQNRFQGWRVIFDGELTSSCEITGIYQQYAWDWSLWNGSRVVDLEPVVRDRPGAFEYLWARATVTEKVTGIARTDSAGTYNPIALRVSNSVRNEVAPACTPDTLGLFAAMLEGMTSLAVEVEYADSVLTLDDVVLSQRAVSAGISRTITQVSPSRVRIELSAGSPVSGWTSEARVARLPFTLGSPRGTLFHPVRLREPSAERDGVAETVVTTLDGGVRLSTDCDEDCVPDRYQAELFPSEFDCNGNGVHDRCDIALGTVEDCNGNLLPDTCDIRNGTSTDTNRNGVPDECEG